MLHCHQFVHHPSIRPAKLSSLFGNSSGSCFLRELTNANINEALSAEGSQNCRRKRQNCLRNRISQPFQTSSIATVLQAYDLQEQIRKISFHDQVEFFNLFQHQPKYFPKSTNSLKRKRHSQQQAPTQQQQQTQEQLYNYLDDNAIAYLSEMIQKTEKEKRDKQISPERHVQLESKTSENELVGQILQEYVHASIFGSDYSPKIIEAKHQKFTRTRRNSTPSTKSSTSVQGSATLRHSARFFSHFPADSLSLVGVGGFGRVYRIQSKHGAFNDERMAVKLIPFTSSKADDQQSSKPGKYGAPILAAAALLAAVSDEERQQSADSESSTEKQVLREVSVLSALSSPFTAKYRFGWVEKWSNEFEQLFNSHNGKSEPQDLSVSTSASASFSETSSEWNSSNSSQTGSLTVQTSSGSRTPCPSEYPAGPMVKPQYDSVLVLLMDYYSGPSLSEFISNPSAHLPSFLSHSSLLPSLLRLYISYQILSSLEYLHAHQCIHRDLAPKNLMLETNRSLLASVVGKEINEQRMDSLLVRLMSNQVSADDMQDSEEWQVICSILAAFNVRVIDFGLSRHFGRNAAASSHAHIQDDQTGMELSVGVGTRAYAAPEQLQRSSSCTCNPRSLSSPSAKCGVCCFADRGDLYSCGLVLAELLCAPFNTQMERIDFLTRMRQRQWNHLNSFQTLPKSLKDVLASMLSNVPQDRPSAAEAKKSKAFSSVRRLMPFVAAQKYEYHSA